MPRRKEAKTFLASFVDEADNFQRVNLQTQENPDGAGVNALLERGFEYFPSPENDDDSERIAYLFLYCSVAVDEWPRFRRRLEKTGAKSAKQCDDLQKNAIDVLREVRDEIITAIETDNLAVLPQPRLLDRLAHAHAFMALHADPTSLPEYRRMICPQIDSISWSRRPDQGDFNKAVWEGKWNALAGQMPAEVTWEETLRGRRSHEMDGLYNTSRRLDPAATACELNPLFPATEPARPLSTMRFGFVRQKLRALGTRDGLPRAQADFLVRMALDGAQEKDNPSAWRAIRDRHRGTLMAKVRELLASLT